MKSVGDDTQPNPFARRQIEYKEKVNQKGNKRHNEGMGKNNIQNLKK